jgi:hypothetical protein
MWHKQCVWLVQQLHEGFFELQICESKTLFLQAIYNNAKWSIGVLVLEEPEVGNDKVNEGGK